MNRPSKIVAALSAAALSFGLVSCAGNSETDAKTVTVGTSPGPYSVLFKDGIQPILEKDGYTVKYTDFSDLMQANTALAEGSVDLNVDQHSAYTEVFNKEKGADLVNFTELPTVPAGLYSQRHGSLDDVATGQSVAIPIDASNLSRALNLLKDADWITIKAEADPALLSVNDVDENPHNLDFKPMDSAGIPRALPDVDWGVLPGSMSYASKVDPNLQLFQENLRPELILNAATTSDKVDEEWVEEVKKAYRDPEFLQFVEDQNVNNYWFIPDSLKG
ncbi:metal ABC transporter substrate-binding protein [Corynebacterium glucuronolyticum]|uniref:Metal ABC transporter substrate-binding protein n=1 Tax=Corynebacterium glucuronolyticum TaxID=39791 RepID=A0A7T4EGI9_9CORY|nr:MetQ/NlpA family ABC transporter substrate-binding protein [Corynebacterium glucuronolyticum]QQB46969.1 metal ABC transporter substrate-binding protein [Corynebacterium glucuronolyticum]WKD64746.1 Membrane lipoprotein TpN32 precursor [Corynebacterium glucuronolyticum DSM 44120]SMB78981.1 D-methionine transport system substrate-binding protein [Corynebacterium glucuronolyticum]